MINIDSITLKIDKDSLNGYNQDCFLKNIVQDNGIVIKDIEYLKSSYRPLGIKKIEMREDCLALEISAKILWQDYKELININSVEKVISNINSTGIVSFKSDMPYQAEVLKCDVTNNLFVKNKLGDYVDDLELFRLNEKYAVKSYNKSESIVFTRRVKTYHERQIYYDKPAELLTAKNKNLVEKINLNDFNNCLRVETNITSFDQIRKSFGVPNRNFAEVLQSKQNPNLTIFKRITEDRDSGDKIKQAQLVFEEFEKYNSLYLYEKVEGRKTILEKLNYDMILVKKFLKYAVGGNNSKYLREYKALARQEQIITELQMANIKEIEYLLKAA